jgi:probable F420-dependent oxidoreductase
MISAQVAWEMAGNMRGKFRLGLGSQIKAHIERRYSSEFDRPAARMRDYMLAVKACIQAFKGESQLNHTGEFYNINLLPDQWAPPSHDYQEIKIDMSAVNPLMLKVTGEVADGLHLHPLHSMPYIHNKVFPALAEGAARADRSLTDIDLIVPVLAAPGDTPEERHNLVQEAKRMVGYYGSTKGYAFQFDDLGYEGKSFEFAELVRQGDIDGLIGAVDAEMLDQFALICRWDEMADRLIERYQGIAHRLVMYLARQSVLENPANVGKWGEIARAVRAAA